MILYKARFYQSPINLPKTNQLWINKNMILVIFSEYLFQDYVNKSPRYYARVYFWYKSKCSQTKIPKIKSPLSSVLRSIYLIPSTWYCQIPLCYRLDNIQNAKFLPWCVIDFAQKRCQRLLSGFTYFFLEKLFFVKSKDEIYKLQKCQSRIWSELTFSLFFPCLIHSTHILDRINISQTSRFNSKDKHIWLLN